MIFFNTRREARDFANKTGRKVVDNGAGADKRWAIEVFRFV